MGLFDWLKRTKSTPREMSHALAMVMLKGRSAPDFSAALQYLRDHWTDIPSILAVESKAAATTGRIDGGMIAAAHVPVPIPAADLEAPIALAWRWPAAHAEIAEHESHVIVHAASATMDRVQLKLLHTKLVAAVAAVSDSVGVYTGDAILVNSTQEYMQEAAAATQASVPVALWIGFNPVAEGDIFSAYTTGLGGFGLLELEVVQARRPVGEVLGIMADVAAYQLQSGAALQHGETLGYSDLERLPIEHVASEFLPESQVARMSM
jgi:hypothetical protein